MQPFYTPIPPAAAASGASSSAAAAASGSGGAQPSFVQVKAETVKEQEQPQEEASGQMTACMVQSAATSVLDVNKVV